MGAKCSMARKTEAAWRIFTARVHSEMIRGLRRCAKSLSIPAPDWPDDRTPLQLFPEEGQSVRNILRTKWSDLSTQVLSTTQGQQDSSWIFIKRQQGRW